MLTCVCCLYKTFFIKQNVKYLILSSKCLLELKLKLGTIFWVGGVGYLTFSSHVTELQNPKFLIRDFWFTLLTNP